MSDRATHWPRLLTERVEPGRVLPPAAFLLDAVALERVPVVVEVHRTQVQHRPTACSTQTAPGTKVVFATSSRAADSLKVERVRLHGRARAEARRGREAGTGPERREKGAGKGDIVAS